MENDNTTESKAAILRHPIHPMLIPFPIAFLTGALITDIVYKFTLYFLWLEFSTWLLASGLVFGLIAGFFGIVDFVLVRKVRRTLAGWVHFISNILVLITAFVNLFTRLKQVEFELQTLNLLLSAAAVILLLVSGWYGGELVYKHKIGIFNQE